MSLQRIPWQALTINGGLLLAGYCFGGRIGLGCAALVVTILQILL